MAQKQSAKKVPQKSRGLTDWEKSAMKETMQERSSEKNDESTVLAKIAEMSESDRKMAKEIHALIKASAPGLSPKTWYGMPAYAQDDKVVCFFQPAQKFKARYSTISFSDKANLDDGQMWPVTYALKGLSAPEKAKIAELVKKAVS